MQNYKMPKREQNSNKGTFGKVLNFAGTKNYFGAAYLSTVSALKIGAGFVALSSEKDVMQVVAGLLPEAVYLNYTESLRNLKHFSTLLVGCGLGNNDKLFKEILSRLQKDTRPIVIDADGLNILAKLYKSKNKAVIEFAKNKEKKLVITPHPLEAARLLDCGLEEVLSNLEGTAKELSKKFNCVVVLKTHRTIICKNDTIFVNQHGNSALAKAGSGDVLAGFIAGLLAQKMDLFEGAKLGAYLHSRAGEIASEELTEYSVLASDLPNYLPKAIKEIL